MKSSATSTKTLSYYYDHHPEKSPAESGVTEINKIMKTIPSIKQTVQYNGKLYTVISCNLGGKCTLKKQNIPNKNKIVTHIDVSELTFIEE